MMKFSALVRLAAAVLCFSRAIPQASSDKLECYKCSYFNIESEATGLSAFFNIISAASNDHCQLSEAKDVEEIDQVFCEEPDEDEENMCVIIKGEVQGEVNIVLTSVDFQYYTVKRDCVTVKKNTYKNGCQQDLPSSGPARDILQKEGSFAIQNMKFKGEACYYNYLTTGAMGIRASWFSPMVVVGVAMLLMLMW